MKYVFKNPFYKILIPALDILGSLASFPLRLFRRKPPPDPKKILVVRLDHIGDFVCTTPVFKNIKKKFPDAQITVLVNAASKELAYKDPNIDKVITFSPFYLERGEKGSTLKGLARIITDVRNIGFDMGIDPRGDLLSILIMWLGKVKFRVGYGITGGGFLLSREGKYDKNIHVIDRNLALLKDLGVPADDRSPAVYFDEKDANVIDNIMNGLKISKAKAAVLHPFAGAKAKEWPFDNFRKVIEWLNSNGFNVLLVGSKYDMGSFNNVIDLKGKINLPQLACLIKSAGFFIGLDSGPANIAAALNVPSVVICSGTNVPELWIPDNSNVKLVSGNVECKPCENKVCPSKNKCMVSISPEDVIITARACLPAGRG